MLNIQPIVNTILSKTGVTGVILTLDLFPPTMLTFNYPIADFKEEESSKWESYSTPGGRSSFPVFTGMEEHSLKFSSMWDIANTNTVFELNTLPQMLKESPYRGPDELTVTIEKLSGLDFISMVKSVCRVLKKPRFVISANKAAASGKILHVSQGGNDPTPPLCVFVKNAQEIFVGYVRAADVTETDHDVMGIPTRINVEFDFVVVPDFIFQMKRDFTDIINATKSLGRL